MYLDPGSGGMVIQIMIAFVVAGGALLFSFRKKLSEIFKKKGVAVAQQPGEAVAFTVGEDDVIDTMDDKGDNI